ncbi:hypothetical protein PG994_005809 [Apiospora phragmitis]|uniref:Carboxylic ester hydrolase n=1 Tax=Apiospora phragmitis TaxID=2905665 RepID=A0ABR1VD99_9PEZI
MDPSACNLTEIATSLSCEFNDALDCLTQAQVSTLIALHQNYTITVDGETKDIFPGPEPGAEGTLLSFVAPTGGMYAPAGQPCGFDWQWPLNFLSGYESGYNYTDKIVTDAEQQRPGMASPRANTTDWARFHSRGGRLIMYHGPADGIVPTKSSLEYFQNVGKYSANRDDFMLYYQVPGMAHCFLSDSYPVNLNPPETFPYVQPQYRAPWFFSAATQGSAVYSGNILGLDLVNNPSTDMFAALVNWMEHTDQKPHDIIATTFNTSANWATSYAQRPVCPFPRAADYTGGRTNDTTSWACPPPLVV